MSDEKKLHSLLSELYDRRRDEIRVSPAWLATEAMQGLDPDRLSPALVYLAAHLQMRQVARSICRERADVDSREAVQHELFPDLQQRYPAAHAPGLEPEYVLLEHLTEEDVMFNYKRMYSEAQTKMRGADALLAWWRGRSSVAA